MWRRSLDSFLDVYQAKILALVGWFADSHQYGERSRPANCIFPPREQLESMGLLSEGAPQAKSTKVAARPLAQKLIRVLVLSAVAVIGGNRKPPYKGKNLCLIDIREAVKAAAPQYPHIRMPEQRGTGSRGGRHLAPKSPPAVLAAKFLR